MTMSAGNPSIKYPSGVVTVTVTTEDPRTGLASASVTDTDPDLITVSCLKPATFEFDRQA